VNAVVPELIAGGDDDGIADVGDHIVEHETDTVAEDTHRGDRDDADDDPGDARIDLSQWRLTFRRARSKKVMPASRPRFLTVRSAYSVIRGRG